MNNILPALIGLGLFTIMSDMVIQVNKNLKLFKPWVFANKKCLHFT
jgi:hypothetical protein